MIWYSAKDITPLVLIMLKISGYIKIFKLKIKTIY